NPLGYSTRSREIRQRSDDWKAHDVAPVGSSRMRADEVRFAFLILRRRGCCSRRSLFLFPKFANGSCEILFNFALVSVSYVPGYGVACHTRQNPPQGGILGYRFSSTSLAKTRLQDGREDVSSQQNIYRVRRTEIGVG
ncbi:hypothetical protein RF55_23852, partial [Lasius niger]